MAFRVPFNKPYYTGAEAGYIAQAMAQGQTSGGGQFTKKCQGFLENKLGCGKVLLTQSCTAALEMAALLCDLKPGDEVILPSFTFVSTANPFCLRGARPVFVDIDPANLTIDADKAAAAITEKTRAIAGVHYAGTACDMDALCDMARPRGIAVIEDAAHALGAYHGGKALGTLGDLGALSFHETKNVISGEGGALLVNNPALAARAEIVWEKGTNRSQFVRGEVDKYTWCALGSSFLPSEVTAAFLYAQLERMDLITKKRRQAFDRYFVLLSEWAARHGVLLPDRDSYTESNGHLFHILAPDGETRDRLIAFLRTQGVQAVFHYLPLHLSPMGIAYRYRPGQLPVTESISGRLLRLPLYFEITEEEQEYVTMQLKAFFRT